MRIDTIYISARSFVYDLRVAASLLDEHNRTLAASPESNIAQGMITSIIRRIENASEVLLVAESPAPETGLGED